MSWRRVAAIYIVLSLLGAWVLVGEDAPSEPKLVTAPGPSLLEADAIDVTSVAFLRDGEVVRAAREDGRWRALDPPGTSIPSDLLEATIATLTDGQSAERLGSEPEQDLAAYGLDKPSATLEVGVGPIPSKLVKVAVGARNPTRTAVYARRNDDPTIYLVGMNLSYYIDLVFDAAKR